MVANWDILNKEFDDLLDRLSNEEWQEWYAKKETQEKILRLELTLRAKIQEYKIFSENFKGATIFNEILKANCLPNSKNVSLECDGNSANPKDELPLAA
jgi:hypothetical protein